MYKIEFYRHNISQEDKQAVLSVLDSLFLTTGDVVAEFEKKFAKYLESKFAVGVMSCTHALELSLRYLNIGPTDEVITTPMSFVATANAIEYVGAKPVFVDVEQKTGNIDANLIENAITKNTKAILPVHLYGQMCDMRKIREIADKYDLKIIEDCAHCIEGMRDGARPGQFGDIACFSFYTTKNLTCGEGGAVVCNNEKIYNWMLQARLHGLTKDAIDRYEKKYEHYDMNFLGMKCNMSNIQASMMIHQLDNLELYLEMREAISKQYEKYFCKEIKLQVSKIVSNSKHARHLYTILVDPKKRDEYLHKLQDAGIGVAVNYKPIHLMKYYREKYGYKKNDFSKAEKIGKSTISLPLYPKLKKDQVEFIVDVVKKIIR
jgi:dTDP-4-amino-4,6-dideoxygalactose transaminase